MYLGGLYTAEKYKKSLDLVLIPNNIHNESLQTMNVKHNLKIASKLESLAIKILRVMSKVNQKTKRNIRKLGFYFTSEVGFPDDILAGYSPKFVSAYFQSHHIHRMALQKNSVFDLLGYSPSEWARELTENEIGSNDIAIHVRLGDYINEKHNIGLVGIGYYEESILRARELGGTGKIRVITNDVEVCQKFLSSITFDLEFVEQPKNVRDFDSLYIMTQHSYLIISNSSFSLLAGLEANPCVVIRPSPWFKNLKEPNELSPPEWIEIPSAWR